MWRALKPLTFTALEVKPSTSIKSETRERQWSQLTEKKGRAKTRKEERRVLAKGKRERVGFWMYPRQKLHLRPLFVVVNHAHVRAVHMLSQEQLSTHGDTEGLEFYISLCMTAGPLWITLTSLITMATTYSSVEAHSSFSLLLSLVSWFHSCGLKWSNRVFSAWIFILSAQEWPLAFDSLLISSIWKKSCCLFF